MRDIKFRAWDTTFNDMHDVVGLDFVDQQVQFMGSGDVQVRDFEVVELMQYTGLKDKNGVEIYEGDIVRLTTKTGGDIDRLCEWSYRDNGWRFQGFNYAGDDQEIIEVIGNIYENPELLV